MNYNNSNSEMLKVEEAFFENWQNLMPIRDCAQTFHISVKTLYDWKYRAHENKVPDGMFVKFRNRLFIRKDVLRHWIQKQAC